MFPLVFFLEHRTALDRKVLDVPSLGDLFIPELARI